MNTLTLFSGLGVDEFYLEDNGFEVIGACELLPARAKAYKSLHKNQNVFVGDIQNPVLQDKIIAFAKDNRIKCIIATPPCQGFSTAGKNKKQHFIGDFRNYLPLAAMRIIESVQPDYALFENVAGFLEMEYELGESKLRVADYLKARFGSTYEIKVDIYDAQWFGVPQRRQRAVIRLYKKGLTWSDPVFVNKPVTLREAIGNLPSLMPGETSDIPNHFARKQPERQTLAMLHTPTGCSAFQNAVFYPKKPDGSRVKGFPNTYKRMKWDEPANTLTMRNECLSSQDNVHPGRPMGNGLYSDPRVLTLREVLIISSMPPDTPVPPNMSETQFRQVIGEGIPPLMLAKIMGGIKDE